MRGHRPCCFNPLFIGADAVTQFCGLAHPFLSAAFHSPVYRGGCCNTTTTILILNQLRQRFNPLFIGADAVTTATPPSPPPPQSWFQSPVYRGGCCNLRPLGGRLRLCVGQRFNPLFIGADAVTPACWWRHASRMRRFNPLFIGADAVTFWRLLRS